MPTRSNAKKCFELITAFFFPFHFSIDQCKFMDSKMRPLYLVFENLDEMGDFVRIIFKNGDGKCLLQVA